MPRPEAAWVHDHAIRTTRYHDRCVPLTRPDWQLGDPMAVLRLDWPRAHDEVAFIGMAIGLMFTATTFGFHRAVRRCPPRGLAGFR